MDRIRRRRPSLTVRGVIEHKGRYLFLEAVDSSSRVPGEPWYFLPGGHVGHEEGLSAALEREVAEETGLKVEAVGPLFAREFIASRHRRLSPEMPPDHHVIALIFLCRPRAGSAVDVRIPPALDETSVVRGARWLAPAELAPLDLRPPHLSAALASLAEPNDHFLFWPEE